MKPLILSILAALVCQASARVGETPAQLAARYGEAKPGAGPNQFHYQKNDIFVRATLFQGVCQEIVYTTEEPNADPSAGGFILPGDGAALPQAAKPKPEATPLTALQIQQLLSANGGGSTWKQTGPDMWSAADDQTHAFLSAGRLFIQTAKYLRHEKSEQDKDESIRTKGF